MTTVMRRLRVGRVGTPIPIAVLIVGTIMFSLVAAGRSVLPGDVSITHRVQSLPDSSLGSFFHLMNALGSTPIMLLIGALLAVAVWKQGRIDAMWLIAAATLGRVANPLLKAIFASPRPTADRVHVDAISSGWGFPSGHVMGMTLLVGTLAYLAWQTWPRRSVRLPILALTSIMLVGSGLGRIYVGAHWPSDVLGAYLYGTLCVACLAWSWQYRTRLASISFVRPIADSILAVPDLVVNSWASRPMKGHRSMGTLVWQRRRVGAIAFGSLLALMLVVVATAQTPSTSGEHAARIIAGSCADPNAATAYDLNPVSLTASDDDDHDDDDDDHDDNDHDAPTGTTIGSSSAVPVAAAGNELNVELNTLTAQPHAIVITAGASNAPVIACGDIGGQLRGDDDLIIGLSPINNSNSAAIAHLDSDDDDQHVDITLYLISWT